MTSYIVRNEIGQSLQLRPFDQKWTWTNSPKHATTFTAADAYAFAQRIRHGDVDEAKRALAPAVVPYE